MLYLNFELRWHRTRRRIKRSHCYTTILLEILRHFLVLGLQRHAMTTPRCIELQHDIAGGVLDHFLDIVVVHGDHG